MNILWDFDGTLFNTYPAFTETMYKLIKPEVKKEHIFEQLKISFSHAAETFGLTEEEISAFKQKEKALSPVLKPPFPYVEDVLKRASKNVIMTHKPRNEVDVILRHYGWEHYFEEIVAGDDGFPRKPHPASYSYLHEKHYIDLAIGDRELDILPAKELGIRTCLFQNDSEGADFYLMDYRQFEDRVAPSFKN
ncbi:HAD family hydrolase [Bacillus sp. FJAT-42376]|uniref:HAD-IA family hydrolase n=1 Tax=Bacillus sp. FJAT-42376 TaxID=2014076 RepID=UPI000F4E5BDD|nr:HAD-IA family hydrolase [Bacillus sp. FJAT-42376]AZB42545.1 HAD family hydrolase [Bacillus sp. FJAT-42376]